MCSVGKQKVKIYKSVCIKTSMLQICGPVWREDKWKEDQVEILLYDSYLTHFLFMINFWFPVKWLAVGCINVFDAWQRQYIQNTSGTHSTLCQVKPESLSHW